MVTRPRHRGSVRIIGGHWRGRRIDLPAVAPPRPTPNRVRETLFNWLAPTIEGARCLDLFAGSGALGIEALSRRAGDIVFVESDPRIARHLEEQLERLGSDAMVVNRPASAFLRDYRGPTFDVVFLDPPYESSIDAVVVEALGLLTDSGCVYLERAKADGLPELMHGRWIKRAAAASVCFGLAVRS